MVQLPPPADLNIQIPYKLSSGIAINFDIIEWHTNAELITGSTSMMRRNGNFLQFIHLSKSLSGVYQIFYKNGDLATVRSTNIYVTAERGKASEKHH